MTVAKTDDVKVKVTKLVESTSEVTGSSVATEEVVPTGSTPSVLEPVGTEETLAATVDVRSSVMEGNVSIGAVLTPVGTTGAVVFQRPVGVADASESLGPVPQGAVPQGAVPLLGRLVRLLQT